MSCTSIGPVSTATTWATIPTTRDATRSSRAPSSSRCHACCTQPPSIIHAHDWQTALASIYLKTEFAAHPYYEGIRAVLSVHNAGYQGHFPESTMADIGLPVVALQPPAARVVGPREPAQGRARVLRPRRHGEPDARARAAHGEGRLRARRRVRRAARPARRHRERHRSGDLGSGARSRSSRVAIRRRTWPARSAAASRSSARRD